MNKICWTISIVLLFAVSLMAYKFIIVGSVAPSSDGRQALQLSPSEQDLVLAEMRAFLESVQIITASVVEKDIPQITIAARKVGATAQQAVPSSLVGKLPLSFKQLGFDTHKQFDTLAMDAEELQDPDHALQQLSVLMKNCVACHAAYRIDSVANTIN